METFTVEYDPMKSVFAIVVSMKGRSLGWKVNLQSRMRKRRRGMGGGKGYLWNSDGDAKRFGR